MSDGVTPRRRKSEIPPRPGLPPEIRQLLDRMADGDRDAVAEFAREAEPVIRRRIREKMGQRMRQVFDSEEALQSTCRRLDQMSAQGKLRVTGQEELRALILLLAEHVVADQGAKASQMLKGDSAEVARHRAAARAERDHETARDRAESIMADARQREALLAQFRARGIGLDVAAAILGQSHDATKQAWARFARRSRRTQED